MVHKVLSAGTLLDPFKLNGFLNVATKSLKADTGLTGNDIKNLALRLRHFSSGGVSFATVPVANSGATRNGQSVVLLDDAKLAAMFDALSRDLAPGTPPPPAKPGSKAPTTPIIVAPSNVQVAVFNGSGITGKGSTAAADIGRVGFQVIGAAQTRGAGATQTTILYGPSKADSAHTLQASIPGSVLQADSNLGRTLQLVVGSSYQGARKVTVSTVKPTPGSKPGVVAAPPVKTAQDNPCTS
jgi:hypothetical protein